ncbi:MAG: type II toxin-antitoxin system HicB family antitoxin [Candidatus Margulisiibacteriota bacterium]
MAEKKGIRSIQGELDVTAEVWKEDPMYVAKCKELKVVSQGDTAAEALSNLEEAIELYLEDESLESIIIPLKFTFNFGKVGASR